MNAFERLKSWVSLNILFENNPRFGKTSGKMFFLANKPMPPSGPDHVDNQVTLPVGEQASQLIHTLSDVRGHDDLIIEPYASEAGTGPKVWVLAKNGLVFDNSQVADYLAMFEDTKAETQTP